MKKTLLICLLLLNTTVFAIPLPDIKTYKYTFGKQEHFTVAYADYPAGQESFYELHFKNNDRLPKELIGANTHGLKISGNNHSDDLFMYAYKKISGLKPGTTYHVDFSIEFASQAPKGSSGVGGSPAENVYMKIGAVSHEPKRSVNSAGQYEIDLDKGNQEMDGKDMILIGTVGVDTVDSVYRLKTLPYMPDVEMQKKLAAYKVTTDKNGNVWIIFGTDSGFEATSTFFYTNLNVGFKEVVV